VELRRKSGQDGGEGLDGRMLGWRGCRFGWLHRLRLAALVRMAAQAWMWEAWMREAAASAEGHGERRRLCGPLGTGEAQVSLARRKPTNPIRREGGALALSEPQ
jgi:hypothetical protein